MTFCQVAKTQHFTRAADTLGMTQPAVTQQIKALEDEFGQALFDRVGRSVQLTPAGEVLLEYAERISQYFSECRTAMADLQNLGRGRLRLGSGLTLSIFMLPGLLQPYRHSHPGIDITVSTGSTSEILKKLRANEVDLALVTGPSPDNNLVITRLYDDEMILVVRPRHRFCARGVISPEELRGESFIFFEQGSGYRTFLEDFFRRAGVFPRIHMDLDSIEAMKKMVEVGLGVTIIPRMSALDEIREGSLVEIKMDRAKPLVRTTTAVYHHDKYLSSAIKAFFAVLETTYSVRIPGGSLPRPKTKRGN